MMEKMEQVMAVMINVKSSHAEMEYKMQEKSATMEILTI